MTNELSLETLSIDMDEEPIKRSLLSQIRKDATTANKYCLAFTIGLVIGVILIYLFY